METDSRRGTMKKQGYGGSFHNAHQQGGRHQFRQHSHHTQRSHSQPNHHHYTEPSKVLHLRNLTTDTTREDIMRSLYSCWDKVMYITMLTKFQQALVEMVDVESATKLLTESQKTPIAVRGSKVLFNYSKSKAIDRSHPLAASKPDPTHPVTHQQNETVLLLSIHNVTKPITTHLLYAVMAAFGKVQRIVIFRKHGTQAFVEFEDPGVAYAALVELDGKHLFTGCCTMRIQFSKVHKLNVRQNDDNTYDYTVALPQGSSGVWKESPVANREYGRVCYPDHSHDNSTLVEIMVDGMDRRMLSPRTTFNIFSLYGNVGKVLITPSQAPELGEEGDREDGEQEPEYCKVVLEITCLGAGLALKLLHNFNLFGRKVNVDVTYDITGSISFENAETDIEKSIYFEDFINSPKNRFRDDSDGTGRASRHIYSPTQVVHFTNVPDYVESQDIISLFDEHNAPVPNTIKIFDAHQNTNSTKKAGLMLFEDIEAATDAIALVNNSEALGKSAIRLSFSKNVIKSKPVSR